MRGLRHHLRREFYSTRRIKFPTDDRGFFQPKEEGLIPFERLACYFKRHMDAAELFTRCKAFTEYENIRLIGKGNKFFLRKGDYHACQRAIFAQLSEEQRDSFPAAQRRYLEEAPQLYGAPSNSRR
ncbi:hypothetical protein J4402_02655 [Candidatus Pacearchaeota archaeon]|nr:hypothetical protein [Candidatus Pacearchaeota archaeon]